MWSLIQIQVVSFVDCSCARIFVHSAAGQRGVGEGKVAGVGDATKGQRFVSPSEEVLGKKANALNINEERLTSGLLNNWAGNENL